MPDDDPEEARKKRERERILRLTGWNKFKREEQQAAKRARKHAKDYRDGGKKRK